MVIDLHNTLRLIMMILIIMMMMMMSMMMKIKMTITWSIFKLGCPNFAW